VRAALCLESLTRICLGSTDTRRNNPWRFVARVNVDSRPSPDVDSRHPPARAAAPSSGSCDAFACDWPSSRVVAVRPDRSVPS
jgi:hypothetical protein